MGTVNICNLCICFNEWNLFFNLHYIAIHAYMSIHTYIYKYKKYIIYIYIYVNTPDHIYNQDHSLLSSIQELLREMLRKEVGFFKIQPLPGWNLPAPKTPVFFKGKPFPYHPWDWYIYLHEWLFLMVKYGKCR